MVKRRLILLLSIISLSAPEPLRAGDAMEVSGDVLEYVLPAATAAATMCLKDWTGTRQFAAAAIVTEGTAGILKCTVKERRPNGENYRSFPSGHTAISCASAEFIRKRYGWRYGAPMYALATFVGYSRIESKHHYFHDVAAGAVIGFVGSFVFTKPYHGVEVSCSARAGGIALQCKGVF